MKLDNSDKFENYLRDNKKDNIIYKNNYYMKNLGEKNEKEYENSEIHRMEIGQYEFNDCNFPFNIKNSKKKFYWLRKRWKWFRSFKKTKNKKKT